MPAKENNFFYIFVNLSLSHRCYQTHLYKLKTHYSEGLHIYMSINLVAIHLLLISESSHNIIKCDLVPACQSV